MKRHLTKKILTGAIFMSFGLNAGAENSADPDITMNLFFLTANMAEVKVSDLKKLHKFGVTGFELPGTVSTMEDCQRLGEYIKANHFRVGLNVAATLDKDPSSVDEGIRAKGIEYLKSRIDCAEEVGADILAGPITLPWGGFSDKYVGAELQKKYVQPKKNIAIKSMRLLADYAKTKNVKLALEPLTHWEMAGLNTLRETIQFLKDVNHENFGVTLDISHEVLDGEGPAVFAQQVAELNQLKKLFYVQVSAPHRGDLKNSWLPWNEFFHPLKKVWNGPLAIEMMNAVPPFATQSGGGLRLSRIPFRDPFETAKEAVEITKAKWKETGIKK